MSETTQSPCVTIEDSVLLNMAGNPAFVAAFPFLGSLRAQGTAPRVRGCCGGRQSPARSGAFNQARAAVANLDADGQRRLKEMLQTARVRVRFLEGNNRREKIF